MALTVVTYPNRVLTRPARRIKPSDDIDLWELYQQMAATMREYVGVGLAAPQVGKSIRFLLAHDSASGELRALVNPLIVESSIESTLAAEGCLSFPGQFANVVRAECIVVRYQDPDFTEHEHEFCGYFARVVQHEIDHLNGVLLIDRAEDGLHDVEVEEESDIPAEEGASLSVPDSTAVPSPGTEAQ
jgi:peptide deformylase